jgi:predicted transcriptional regulator
MGHMATAFKDQAHKLIDRLPETADWDELIYQAVVCKEIEAGLADSAAGRVTPAEDVLREFGLAE